MFQTAQRQLRYNTTVVYNNEIGVIRSISSTNSVKIEVNGKLLDVEKNKLKAVPHDTNDIIKFQNNIYQVKNIRFENNKVYYDCWFYIEKKNIIISPDLNQITSIDNTKQEQYKKYFKFMDDYNFTIDFLKTRKKKHTEMFGYNSGFRDYDGDYYYLNYKNVEDNICNLLDKCGLKFSQLNTITQTLKKTHNPNLQIENIYENPFDFITQEYQLITYEKAEKICNDYKLSISIQVKLEKWSYDLFLKQRNTLYIITSEYFEQMKKFCIERGEHPNKLAHCVKNFLIDIEIDSKIYKTTQYFKDLEEKMTNDVVDLYYDMKYDIDVGKINNIIDSYEKKIEKERTGPFVLEPEQRNAVINSIRNKLSIIVGPPGTGKTEILRCINYVMRELYDKNEYVSSVDVSLLAPTGLAYVNMQRSQERSHYCETISGTCHRLVHSVFPNIKSHKYKCNCLEDKCKFKNLDIGRMNIDEVSMLDTFMFAELLEICMYFKSRLILLGDIDQLPPIGPGNILNKLISCGIFSVSKLTKIKRQNAGSLVNCINKMSQNIPIGTNDFGDESISLEQYDKFSKNGKINEEKILHLIEENKLNVNNSIFIVGYKTTKKVFNTQNMNLILQNIYNSENIVEIPKKYANITFRVNDKIIRTENDYSGDKVRANGEPAKIIDFDGKSVTIEYADSNGSPEKIGILELYQDFTLNYCITVHKAQGSQYKNVVFIIEPDNYTERTKIYTGISRAKEKCIILARPIHFVSSLRKSTNDRVSIFMEVEEE